MVASAVVTGEMFVSSCAAVSRDGCVVGPLFWDCLSFSGTGVVSAVVTVEMFVSFCATVSRDGCAVGTSFLDCRVFWRGWAAWSCVLEHWRARRSKKISNTIAEITYFVFPAPRLKGHYVLRYLQSRQLRYQVGRQMLLGKKRL